MIDWGSEEGFTLLETVVAVAILAAALAVIYPIYGTAVPRVDTITKRQQTLEFLESKLEETLLLRNWVGLPKSQDAAAWQDIGNGWRYKLTEAELEVGSATTDGVQGRLLQLSVLAQREDGAEQPIALQQAFWVRDP